MQMYGVVPILMRMVRYLD